MQDGEVGALFERWQQGRLETDAAAAALLQQLASRA
jgi:hypothetical protein